MTPYIRTLHPPPPCLRPSRPQEPPPSDQLPQLPRRRPLPLQRDQLSGESQIQRPSSEPGGLTSSSPWRTSPTLEDTPSSPPRREVSIAQGVESGSHPPDSPGSPGPRSSLGRLEESLLR